LQSELGRYGLAARGTFAVDWTVGSGDVTGTYDRVLVDAPCSGVGTLRRRPDLLLRRTEASLGELATMQLSILEHVAPHVKPGGRLVYAVCSVLREEAEDVVERFLAAKPGFSLVPFDAEALATLALDAPTLRLLPPLHGTDGYFLASLRAPT
ncbi:MAG TPA: Sun protein, partial [Polyangiaceae bacterium]